MKTLFALTHRRWQNGYVSVLVVLALSMVVLTILIQSVRMNGTKALESQQYLDSIQALALAEGGMEIALGKFINSSSGINSSTCSLSTLNPSGQATYDLGTSPGKFSYVSASVIDSGTSSYCKIRVRGNVRTTNRTIETWVGISSVGGTSGYGRSPTLTLPTTYGTSSLGVFDLAWRVKGSDGYDAAPNNVTDPNNVSCTSCSTNSLWYQELPGSSAIGGAGNGKTAASGLVYSPTLGSDRNYVMAGLVMGGKTGAPTALPGYIFSSSSNASQVSNSASGNGCSDPYTNALVLGISGRGVGLVDNVVNASASFQYATLSNGSGGNKVALITPTMWRGGTSMVHYPNTDGSTPQAKGDVFVDIFYYYRDPVVVSVNGNGNCGGGGGGGGGGATNPNDCNSSQIRVSSTTGLAVNDTIRIGSSNYDFSKITGISGNVLTINPSLSRALNNNESVCKGLCSLLPITSNQTTLTLTGPTSSSNKGWVAGIACIANVDDTKVKVVESSTLKVIKWHEVISGE